MIYIRVYCLLHVPSMRFEMLSEVKKSVTRSCPSQAGLVATPGKQVPGKTIFTGKGRLREILRLELTLAATLSLVDVKPTNWEICAFC